MPESGVISIYLDGRELEVIDAAASLAGLSRSAFLRTAGVEAARSIAEREDVEEKIASRTESQVGRLREALTTGGEAG